MIKAKIISNLYDQVRKLIPEVNEIFIGGGCIRDYFNECSSFKDIDFFVEAKDRTEAESILKKVRTVFGKEENLSKEEFEQYENFRNIINVSEFKFRFNSPFQLIFIKRINKNLPFTEEVFSTFDFNINCSYYNHIDGFRETKESNLERLRKSFTIRICYNNGSELQKIVAKFNRLQESKYKDYTLYYNKDSFK